MSTYIVYGICPLFFDAGLSLWSTGAMGLEGFFDTGTHLGASFSCIQYGLSFSHDVALALLNLLSLWLSLYNILVLRLQEPAAHLSVSFS